MTASLWGGQEFSNSSIHDNQTHSVNLSKRPSRLLAHRHGRLDHFRCMTRSAKFVCTSSGAAETRWWLDLLPDGMEKGRLSGSLLYTEKGEPNEEVFLAGRVDDLVEGAWP